MSGVVSKSRHPVCTKERMFSQYSFGWSVSDSHSSDNYCRDDSQGHDIEYQAREKPG